MSTDERWAAADAGDLYDERVWPPPGTLFDDADGEWPAGDWSESMSLKGRHRRIEVAASVDDFRPPKEWAGQRGEKE